MPRYPYRPLIRPLSGSAASSRPTMKLFTGSAFDGVSNLDPNLTINGVTETPVFRYKLGDANATNLVPWVYGETLGHNGTGEILNDGSPLLGSNDDSIKVTGATHYEASNGSFADLTFEDIVFEAVFKYNDVISSDMCGKRTTGNSWEGRTTNVNTFQFFISDGTLVQIQGSAVLVNGSWYHAIVFVDRSGHGQIYINGVANGVAKLMTPASGSLTVGNNFAVCSRGSGSTRFRGNLAYVAMWARTDWLDTHLQAAIAQERFNKLTGIHPVTALGTATPTLQARATVAMLDKLEGGEAQVLVDGDMEDAGVGDWTAINCTLSKETASPRGGSQSLRVTKTGGPTATAHQAVVTVGKTYRVTGWGRGDGGGNTQPRLSSGAGALWTGTNSTAWQYFDEVYFAPSTSPLFQALAGGLDEWVEFDDMVVEELPTRKIYNVGASWLRAVERLDKNADSIKGYLSELEAENLTLQSEDFTTTWAQGEAGDAHTGIGFASPEGEDVPGIVMDNTSGSSHYWQQTATVVAATSYTYSVFAKKGDHDWIRLIDTAVGSSNAVYFDLDEGVLGSVGAAADAGYIEDWGNGWFRCSYTWTTTGVTANSRINIAAASGNIDVVGDGATVSIYLWGAQLEKGVYATSYVPTVASAVTRNKDELTFKGDDGNLGGVGSELEGTIVCKTLMGDYDNTGTKVMWDLSDGGASADRILFGLGSSDKITMASDATGGNPGIIAGSVDGIDGVIHTYRFTWITDNMIAWIDETKETPDTSVDIPDDLDEIDIGMNRTSALQLNGVLSNLNIYKKSNKRAK